MTPPLAIVGAGEPTALLARHLLDSNLPVDSRYLPRSATHIDLSRYAMVLMLYARSHIAERFWPRVLRSTRPGTTIYQLGPHDRDSARRMYCTAAMRDSRVVHAPLAWTPRRNALYLPLHSRRALLHQRRAAPDTNHTVLDALLTLAPTYTRTVLGQ